MYCNGGVNNLKKEEEEEKSIRETFFFILVYVVFRLILSWLLLVHTSLMNKMDAERSPPPVVHSS